MSRGFEWLRHGVRGEEMVLEVEIGRLICSLLSECAILSLEFEGAGLPGWVLGAEFEVKLRWL